VAQALHVVWMVASAVSARKNVVCNQLHDVIASAVLAPVSVAMNDELAQG